MKLPWDKNYFKLCFYFIITFTAVYLIKMLLDACAYTITNPAHILKAMGRVIKITATATAPIITSLVLYYVLKPLRDRLEKAFKSRTFGAVCCILLIVLPIIGISLYLFHLVKNDLLISSLSKAVATAYSSLEALADKYSLDFLKPNIEKYSMASSIYALVAKKDIIKKAANILLCLGLGLIMSLYLLMEAEPFKDFGRLTRIILPKKIYSSLSLFFEDMDAIFQGYIRGQLTDGLIMSVLISIGMYFCKIPFGLLIGIVSGFSNLIPYFGAVTGMILGVLGGILSGRPVRALYAFIVIIALQQLDSLYIVPRVVGKPVKISPFLVIASLSIGGRIAGIFGLVLAVPVAAVLRLLILRVCERNEKGM